MKRRTPLSRILIVLVFLANMFGPMPVQADEFALPKPGTMIAFSTSFSPAIITGMTVHPENPLQLDFIVDTGDNHLQGSKLKAEAKKLINYFMATLTVPDDEMWVNLSPYEKNRIIADGLSRTEMGRDMLAQDYILKQLTASLIYPESSLGKEFWKTIYTKAQEQFGTTQIPTNLFNKVWIVPQDATVYVHGNNVFVTHSHLKVMLEDDYLSLDKHAGISNHPNSKTHILGSQVVREIVLPALENEVNEGKNFANLRQIYNSMILSTWYKTKLKAGLFNQIYLNKNKTNGIELVDKTEKDKIYRRYLQAYKKGVYSYIKEEQDPATQQFIPRKYFSGGLERVKSVSEGLPSPAWVSEQANRQHVCISVRGDMIGSDGAMLTPSWPKRVPDRTNVAIDDTVKKFLAVANLILLKVNHDIATQGKTKENTVNLLLGSVRAIANHNDALFEGAVSSAESALGKPTDTSSFQEWMIYVRRIIFNLNVSFLVEHGWLIDIGHDEHQLLRARREQVKYYEIIHDGDHPVLLVQVGSDDSSIPGYRILYDSIGSYVDPGTVILGELPNEWIDEEYDAHLGFAQHEGNREATPSVTRIVGYLSGIDKEKFRQIFREQLLNEEWGHYQEFRERENIQKGAMHVADAEQIERHLNIAFPESSKHPVVRMVRGILNIYLTFHKKQEHAMPSEMLYVITEASRDFQNLYFAPSYEHFIVALANTTKNIFSEDSIQREASRIVLFSFEKVLRGQTGPRNDGELDGFSQELQSFIALPEMAKFSPDALYAKVKEMKDAAMFGTTEDFTKGGIDFNSRNMNLKEQGQQIKFSFNNYSDIHPDAVNGILPVITNIWFMTDFQSLLGVTQKSQNIPASN